MRRGQPKKAVPLVCCQVCVALHQHAYPAAVVKAKSQEAAKESLTLCRPRRPSVPRRRAVPDSVGPCTLAGVLWPVAVSSAPWIGIHMISPHQYAHSDKIRLLGHKLWNVTASVCVVVRAVLLYVEWSRDRRDPCTKTGPMPGSSIDALIWCQS